MTLTEALFLGLAAVAGGAVNAIAGGGTLITFPTLLLFNTPPVVANATSTLALVIGNVGGVYGYRRHLSPVEPWLRRFIPVSLAGGFVGSVLLTRTSDERFANLVPFLIFFATILFMAQGLFQRWARLDAGEPTQPIIRHVTGAIVFQFLVSVYGGFFGAGIGILMLATLGYIGLHNIHEMNTVKTVLGLLINVVAALWFIAAGLIHWPKAGVMTAGALAGYYLGSHFAQRIPQKRVRQVIAGIGFLLSAITFYEEFVR